MNLKAELVEVLGRLDRREDVDRSRRRAKTIVEQLDFEELSDLSEALARNGMYVSRARFICPAHLNIAPGYRKSFRKSLPKDHVLAVLMDEHVHILAALEKLLSLVDRERPPEREVLEELLECGAFLVDVEPHHAREEKVLFPAMRKRGIEGPTAIMDREHILMRRQQTSLRDMVQALLDGREITWSLVRETGVELSQGMREHIFREDNILFPMAADAIRPASAWDELKRLCDEIGYCCRHDHREGQ